MCDPVSAGVLIGASMYQQNRQASAALSAQKDANANALQMADKQAAAIAQANQKANAKQPDLNSLQQGNEKAAASGTLLTGSQGIDPSKLMLGRATLLGA